MLQIAVCDDDKVFLNTLVEAIGKILFELNLPSNIQSFIYGSELIANVKKDNACYDIIILDIDMPRLNGKETAKQLRELNSSFKLIFISSMNNEVYNTFQYYADAFVPKNMLNQLLKPELTRILNEVSNSKTQLHLFEVENEYKKKSIIRLPLIDIVYFESINRTIYMHTKRKTYTLTKKLFLSVKEEYLEKNFVQIHRTCIVNIRYIYSINDIDVTLDNKKILPLSRRQKKNVIKELTEFVNKEIMYD
ncbi:MAG: response regulator transcription factor [Clostridiales bacterium]|nr:response regulator transcription factor [Clostridiales bacterium]